MFKFEVRVKGDPSVGIFDCTEVVQIDFPSLDALDYLQIGMIKEFLTEFYDVEGLGVQVLSEYELEEEAINNLPDEDEF